MKKNIKALMERWEKGLKEDKEKYDKFRIRTCPNCLKENTKFVKKWFICGDCRYEWEERK